MSAETPRRSRYLPPALAERLRGLTLHARTPVLGGAQGPHRSPAYGASVEFAEYRDYAPGDPVRRIDWAVYGRTDRYVIRRFREETSLRAVVFLDVSASMGFRESGEATKFEYGCFLAAALACILSTQGDAVGLVACDGSVRTSVPPTRGPDGLRQFLAALDDLEPSGESDLDAAFRDAGPLLPPRCMALVVSDLLEESVSAARALRRLAHGRHDATVFHILDRGEMRLAFDTVAEVRDLETGARLTVEPDETRDAYADAVDAWMEEIRRAVSDCGACYCFSDTSAPVEEAVAARAVRA